MLLANYSALIGGFFFANMAHIGGYINSRLRIGLSYKIFNKICLLCKVKRLTEITALTE